MIPLQAWALSICLVQLVASKAVENTGKDGKYLDCPKFPSIPNSSVVLEERTYAILKCVQGYKLQGDTDKFKCDHFTGSWRNLDLSNLPRCVKFTDECNIPRFQHSVLHLNTGSQTSGVQFCFNGYSLHASTGKMRSLHVECLNNRWYYQGTAESVKECSEDVRCQDPPVIAHASKHNYEYYHFFDGDKVYYECSEGYQMNTDTAYITCKNGHWVGNTPYCEAKPSCRSPPEISHAQWMVDESIFYPEYEASSFPVGTHVRYSCMNSYPRAYRMYGNPVIECLSNGEWTNQPMCLSPEESAYCELPRIENGQCLCYGGLEECTRLTVGSRAECTCNTGYTLEGQQFLKCQGNTWNHVNPICRVDTDAISTDSTEEPERGHMNTLAIVVATACSVLGLLLLVMVIVVFRRRKPHHHHSRLYHPGISAPPYQRVHSSHFDEHDRMALIGYESARLPSYEEATRNRSAGQSSGRANQAGSDYRPLPNIPSNILSSVQSHNNNNNNSVDNTSRHSVITTSTVNRDGVSEVFGSIDTVNFSTCTASDASTAVTVDSLDSRTSRPSNGSGTATAGSLENVSSDNAPLLENSEQIEEDNSLQLSSGDTEICSDSDDKEAV